MLSDGDIRGALSTGDIRIEPEPSPDAIQPASVDLRLGSEFAMWKDLQAKLSLKLVADPADPKDPGWPEMEKVEAKEYLELPTGIFVLGTTLERVSLGPRVAARVEGRSTLGRLGLVVHATAGFIDPGFEGNITLELFNMGAFPIRLRPGMSICQLAFDWLETPARAPYGSGLRASKYQGQSGVKLPVPRKGRI